MRNLALLLGLSLLSQSTVAVVINVPDHQPTIQAGVNAASKDDTVLVANGTFTGAGNRDIDTYGKEIVILSSGGPEYTIIDCQASSSDPHRGFFFHSGETSLTIVEGFTIQGGYAPVNSSRGLSEGGGILCDSSSSPRILNTIFRQNNAEEAGGGICCLLSSAPTLLDCTFDDNTAIGYTGFGLSVAGYGGAIRCMSSSPYLKSCMIVNNQADIGGGMSCSNSGPILEVCTFRQNTATKLFGFDPIGPGVGGGIHLFESAPMLIECVFDRNIAEAENIMHYYEGIGGGMAVFDGAPHIINCTFVENLAEPSLSNDLGEGAALFLQDSPAIIENCIISYHFGGQVIDCSTCGDTIIVPSISCTDIWANEHGDWVGCIVDQADNDGNFGQDPLFCDYLNGDLHVSTESPCIPNHPAHNCRAIIGALKIGCGDFICGDPNIDGQVNVGDAVYLIAYVFKGGPEPQPMDAGDANCDGDVNVGDAVYLIAYVFSSGAEPCCP
jgi:hypothetical protein